MGDVLKKFGRYFLLDHVAQGGMAEIYRARLASADGAGRLIVIKRIQAGFGANSEFLQMFKSEIKVTMGFNHPNIVQLYDFGEEKNQPYIAMEFVDGRNLRQFSTRFAELKQHFPVDLASHIIEQAAAGLNYAHSFRDKISGTPLNIVHRDISPQNILIAFEGTVKVIDFGIAKAATNAEATRAGVIKGKPSYLSPEQISGEVLDGRSDIFALGAVFWELLVGKKLFAGENDLAVLKLIESCQTYVKPPSSVNPKVPKELDYIVLKMLAKQRDKRYNADELQRALHKFLYSFSSDFNPSDLGYCAKDLFKNEIVEDRKKIQRLNDKAEQLLAEAPSEPSNESSASEDEDLDEPTVQVTSSKNKVVEPKTMTFSLPTSEAKFELEASPQATSTSIRRHSPAAANPTREPTRVGTMVGVGGGTGKVVPRQMAPAQKSSSGGIGKFIGLAAVALVAIAYLGPDFGVSIPVLSDILGASSDSKLVLSGNQKDVTVSLNDKVVANSLPVTLNRLPAGVPLKVTVTGSTGVFQQEVNIKKGEKKVIEVLLEKDKAGVAGKSILLKINLSPGGSSTRMTLNEKPVDYKTSALQVPLDSPLEIVVEHPGFKPFKRDFVLSSKELNGIKETSVDVSLDPLQFGFLTIHSTPSADVLIPFEGDTWKKKSPMENEKIPIGQYDIRLVNDVLGMEKTVSVTIEESKTVNLDVKLELPH